ncbi:MAG: hypothetical protein AAB495_04510 [Patescibacteria group bacterium]
MDDEGLDRPLDQRRFDAIDDKAKEIEQILLVWSVCGEQAKKIAEELFRWAIAEETSGRLDGVATMRDIRDNCGSKTILICQEVGGPSDAFERLFLGWAKNERLFLGWTKNQSHPEQKLLPKESLTAQTIRGENASAPAGEQLVTATQEEIDGYMRTLEAEMHAFLRSGKYPAF